MPVVSYGVDFAACVPYAATHYTLHGYTSVQRNRIYDLTESRHWLGSWPLTSSNKQGLYLVYSGGEDPLTLPPRRIRIMPCNASFDTFCSHTFAFSCFPG